MKKFLLKFKGPFILLIAAFFWGTTFVAQSLGSDNVSPFTFNALRFLLTGVILLIYYLIFIRKREVKNNNISTKKVYLLALMVGVSLAIASNLQQFGITFTKSPSKSGFITSLYIVFVPIIGLFFKKRVSIQIVICLIIALIGSYLISSIGVFKFEMGDVLTLCCAIFFALQIVLIDKVNPYISSVKLCSIQFIVAGLLSFVLMLAFEGFNFIGIKKAWLAIMYAALFSGCIAYTCQIVGQKYTEPTVAALVMSLESLFALVSGVIILDEVLSVKEWIGCILIFMAVIISQIRIGKKEGNV